MVNIVLAIISSLFGAFLALTFKNRKNSSRVSDPDIISGNYVESTLFYEQNRYAFFDVNKNDVRTDSNILKRIGYFLGVANDEENLTQYTPTPMQDVNPEELA